MRLWSFMIAALVLCSISALPLNEKEKRQLTNAGDSSVGPEVETSQSKGCFVVKEDVRTYTAYKLDPVLRKLVEQNLTETRLIRHCCDGYTGDECNESSNAPDAVTCGNLTCEQDPNAYCAVIRKCGREIPMFLDDKGLPSTKCNQTVDLKTLSCSGVCKEDPCSNAHCAGYPSATCFPIGCECKAVWLAKDPVSGQSVEVNCGGGNVRPKRADAVCNNA